MHIKLVALCLLMYNTQSRLENTRGPFPETFRFGVASSSYQTEGAWNLSGKGVSIWDTASHTPGRIVDSSTGDIACDSYHNIDVDVRLLKELKVHYYRFSFSWTRLLPLGVGSALNPDGVAYYNKLIDALVRNGIEPVVTIFHWDLPQMLEDLGGWTNDLMIGYYVEYADILFRLFGDRVKTWCTMNEPANYCQYTGSKAPFKASPGIGSYQCAHNIIRAHAKAYRLYQRKYKFFQGGVIGIVLDSFWVEPLNNRSISDVEASRVDLEFYFGWFAYPIYLTGDYPTSMRSRIDARSFEQGFLRSRLPRFTWHERQIILGSWDFIGVNHYATFLSTFDKQPPAKVPSIENDRNVLQLIDPQWKNSSQRGFTVRPISLTRLLLWISDTLGRRVPIIITENGYNGFQNESLIDLDRVDYLNGYVQATLDAINQGANVLAYTWWSFMDSFEWVNGYTKKFGFYQVDFNDPNRTRRPKASAAVYRKIIETRYVNKSLTIN